MASELIDSVGSLVEMLRQLQLLSNSQMTEVANQLCPKSPDPRVLARELIQRAWLTPYQINQLLTGKGPALRFGPYSMLERLGEGATGQVFKARHVRMDRIVALKLLRPELLTDPEVVQRFYREIQVISHLSHPHIVHAFDAGHIGEMHYLVMEYVEGSDLTQMVKRSGPLPVGQACAYLYQAALGLQHAHEKGLVHRDIKPSNLIMTQRRGNTSDSTVTGWGQVKLLDLGLARVPRSHQNEDTSLLTVNRQDTMGTPDFMAPEQALDFHTADIRADLYSLGCTAYYLLAGEAPFAGSTLAQKLLRHQQTPPPSLSERRSDVPPAVAAIINKLLAKAPEERFQTPLALADALAPIVGTEAPVPVAEPVGGAVQAALPSAGRRPMAKLGTMIGSLAAAPRIERRTRRLLVLCGGGLLGMILLLALYLSLRSPSNPAQGNNVPASAGSEAEDSLPAAFAALEGRHSRWMNGTAENAEPLRMDLLRFQREHPGTPQALQSAVLVSDLPSPLDRLNASEIPANQRRAWQNNIKELVAVLGEHRGHCWNEPTCVAVSPDGKRIACGFAERQVWLFDGESLLDLAFITLTGPISSITFSNDNQFLAIACSDGLVNLWMNTGAQMRQVFATKAPVAVHQLAFAPSGKHLALACGDGQVHLLQHADNAWKTLPPLKGSTEPVLHIAFSTDSKLLASGGNDGLIRLWEAAEQGFTEKATLKGQTPAISALAFHPDGRHLFAASSDKSLRLWDIQDPDKVQMVSKEEAARPTSLSLSPDGKFLAATLAWTSSIRLWDLSDLAQPRALPPLSGNVAGTTAAAFVASGKSLVSVGGDRRVRLWDFSMTPPQERNVLPAQTAGLGGMASVAVTADGSLLATKGRGDPFVQVWHLGDPMPRERGRPHSYGGVGPGMLFTPDNKVLWNTSYQTLLACPLTNDKFTSTEVKSVQPNGFSALAMTPDGKTLASVAGGDPTIRLWDLVGTEAKDRPSIHLKDPKALPRVLAFSPDGKTLAILASDKKLHFWNVSVTPPTERHGPIAEVSDSPRSVHFSPDGKLLGVVAGKDSSATLWEWNGSRSQIRRTLGGASAPLNPLSVSALAFSPDGKSLAIVGQGIGQQTVQVHDVAGRQSPRTWMVPGSIADVTFSSDSRHLVTANGNGTVYVLRLALPATPAKR